MENRENMESAPSLSRRVESTDDPIMVQMREISSLNTNALPLSQGSVYWLPPEPALAAAREHVLDPACSKYVDDDGVPELREALKKKVMSENGLQRSSIMVTSGANQAFMNVVITICDPGDKVMQFKPFYFNHQMAFQMTGITDFIYGPCCPETFQPDVDWLEACLQGQSGRKIPKAVVVTNPNNPTGVVIQEHLLQRIAQACKKAGVWLVLDNTYEYFVYDGRKHVCLEGPNIINIFSFSKAYGMMGWRVGYIAYPEHVPGLAASLLKVQDTIPICANVVAQKAALAALRQAGRPFVDRCIAEMLGSREVVRDALSVLGSGAVKGGQGALYFWARLPEGRDGKPADDRAAVRWLVKEHGVAVIPGSACGQKGFIRVAFASLRERDCAEAARRLRAGLQALINGNMQSVT